MAFWGKWHVQRVWKWDGFEEPHEDWVNGVHLARLGLNER